MPGMRVTPEQLDLCRLDPRAAWTIRGPHSIICLECGEPLMRISQQHLAEHRLTLDLYKSKYGYNRGAGLVCKALSTQRSRIAARQGLASAGRGNLRPFIRGHRGYGRRLQGTLNVSALHRGKPKLCNRKVVDGASDFEIAERRLRGEASGLIAKRVGLSESAVFARLRRLGFPSGRGGPRSWCPAFEHGAPMTGQAIRDLLEATGMTALQLTRHLGVSPSALYPHLRRPSKTISFSLGRKIQAAREYLQRIAPTKQGGRPTALLPADRRTLREKYHALHRDLTIVRDWMKQRDRKVNAIELQSWICDEARAGRIRTLLFWPAFFKWCRDVSPGLGFLGEWRPQDAAFQFLALDYGVTERAVSRAVWGA